MEIEDGEILATINKRYCMVRFHDNPEKYNSARMLVKLDEEMQKCLQLDAKLKEMDSEIAICSEDKTNQELLFKAFVKQRKN